MDEKGFLAAILIQQKQVDQLISASARERAQVIEKLTGVASITHALTESRQEHNTLKKVASRSTIDENALEEMQKELAELREDQHARTAEFNDSTEKFNLLKEEGIKLRKTVEEAESNIAASAAVQEQLIEVKATIKAKEEELAHLMEAKDERKSQLSQFSSEDSLEDLERQKESLDARARDEEKSLYKKESRKKELESLRKEWNALVESVDITYSVEDDTAGLVESISVAEKAISTASATLNRQAGEIRSIEKAIKVLDSDDGSCPTCLQKVDDAHSAISSLKETLESLSTAHKAEKKRKEEFEASLTDCRKELDLLTRAAEAEGKLKETSAELESLLNEIQHHETEKKSIAGEVKALDKILRQTHAQSTMRKEYQRVLDKAQRVSDDIEKLRQRVINLESKKIDTLSSSKFESLKKKLEKTRKEFTALSNRRIEKKGEISLYAERIKHLKKSVSIEEEAVKKHREILESVEVAAASTQVLAKFRQDRIETSVPIIESYASDLIGRFTEGKFNQFKLDSKFNATVVLANGTERPVGLLSGGELSAAAMSLRLAISLALSDGVSHNLIILDEVLVSQDTARAELILNTIKEVSKGQMILIAHNDSITEIADKEVTLS